MARDNENGRSDSGGNQRQTRTERMVPGQATPNPPPVDRDRTAQQ